jgi:hypothetical protein
MGLRLALMGIFYLNFETEEQACMHPFFEMRSLALENMGLIY